MTLVPRIVELMRRSRADDVRLVVGGVVPDEDVPALRAMGVADVILQDTPRRRGCLARPRARASQPAG